MKQPRCRLGLSNHFASTGVLSLEIGPALDMQRTKGYDMGVFLQLETQEHLESFAKDPHHLRLAKVTTDMRDEYLRTEDSMTCVNKYAKTALRSTWFSRHVSLTWDQTCHQHFQPIFPKLGGCLAERLYVGLCSIIQYRRSF